VALYFATYFNEYDPICLDICERRRELMRDGGFVDKWADDNKRKYKDEHYLMIELEVRQKHY